MLKAKVFYKCLTLIMAFENGLTKNYSANFSILDNLLERRLKLSSLGPKFFHNVRLLCLIIKSALRYKNDGLKSYMVHRIAGYHFA